MRILLIMTILLGLAQPLSWARQDISHRARIVEEYLNRFAGPEFRIDYPKIYKALTNAFMKLPEDVFTALTNPRRPVVFVSNITTGIARYAHSTEFIKTKASTFQQGFYLITLADELNTTDDVEAIEGIIFHELAHRYLEHLRRDHFSCEMEKEANNLVKKWGFEEEFLKAKKSLAAKNLGIAPVRIWKLKTAPSRPIATPALGLNKIS